ncbi:MAG: hypothetical protein P4L83_00510 [Nevskia sp.]|nr:hypothetical protein [Nevskia sp.]
MAGTVSRDSCGAEAGLGRLGECFLDRDWRLRNLYYITDKSARRVLFEPNWAQRELFDTLGHRNVDLKVRQLGVTTGYCILWLDACLFNRDLRVGIVAHTKDDASIIFRDKIKFAYDNLPAELRAVVRAEKCDAHELLFDNGSGIRVGVTFRSGTVQVLHVTEYGYVCQRQPQRAEEIKTGAFQAVPANGIIVVESTAKGRAGHFHELCQAAQKDNGWRFAFLPWWREPGYTSAPERPLEYAHESEYLDGLQAQLGVELTPGQRQWWCGKHRELGNDMYAEYPSTPEEAFRATTQGVYFGSQMLEAWQDKRITAVPVDPSLLVDTWWDLGMNDETFAVVHGHPAAQQRHRLGAAPQWPALHRRHRQPLQRAERVLRRLPGAVRDPALPAQQRLCAAAGERLPGGLHRRFVRGGRRRQRRRHLSRHSHGGSDQRRQPDTAVPR